MSAPSTMRAAEDVASQVAKAVTSLSLKLRDRDTLRALAIVTTDDFSSILIHADSAGHLAKTNGRPIDKWLTAEWHADLTVDLSRKVLRKELGDATDDDPGIQALWLVAIIEGLKLARSRGTLKSGGAIPAFCSMTGDRNAIWIESASAQAANSPEMFASFKDELAAASKEWSGEGTAQGRRRSKPRIERSRSDAISLHRASRSLTVAPPPKSSDNAHAFAGR